MQTSDRSGIICDHCGTSHKADFTYYSFDFHGVASTDGRMLSLDFLRRTQVVCSLDICTSCFDNIGKTIVENYKKCIADVKDVKSRRICELTKSNLGDNYYYCTVTKVSVKTTGQPNICVKCQKRTHDATKPCSCGSNNYVRPASTHTDKLFVEFSLCEDAFVTMRRKAEDVRKSAGGWTTKA